MTYRVLARKYRPKKFSEVVGQESAIRVLANALDRNRLHHAYLFTGTRGVGKTTIARLFTAALNCKKGISSSPCGSCVICTEISRGSFVDLMEVDAASRTGVEDTRALLENVQFMPVMGQFKVYLIDEVHMLSTSSFNALLKTLEEPPDHAKFLLATTDPKKIPVTVLSRCLQFYLRNIPRDVIAIKLAEILAAESVTYEEGTLQSIAKAADGSMRDALSLTDQAISYAEGTHIEMETVLQMLGIARGEDVSGLFEAIVRQDRQDVFRRSKAFADTLTSFENIVAVLMSICHEVAMSVATGREIREELRGIRERCTPEWVQSAYQILLMGMRDLPYASEPQVGFEMTLVRLLDFEPLLPHHDQPITDNQSNPMVSNGSGNQQSQRKPHAYQRKSSGAVATTSLSKKDKASEETMALDEETVIWQQVEQDPHVQKLLRTSGGKITGVRRRESTTGQGGEAKGSVKSHRKGASH